MIETGLVRTFGVSTERAAHLADTYGTRAADVMAFCAERPDDRPVGVGTELTVAEIVFLTQQEDVVRLGDLVLRRTTLAITGTIDTGLAEAIASVAGRELGWDEARRRAEIEDLVADLDNYHGVDRSTLDRRTKERTAQCV
jgi:glycerol-3-phosphate dehydrogenase